MTSFDIHPVILIGSTVRLEPLSEAHTSDLWVAGQAETIWKYMRYGNKRTREDMRSFILSLLDLQALGTDLPFAVIHLESGRAIGMTRYLEIHPANRRLEIGGTWYAVEFQRTQVNTECKFLLLRYAFEELGCVRVQLKADVRNERSIRAIERIGAVREGVLRNHMVLPDGYIRSTIMYSVIDEEWPAVKANLLKKLRGKGRWK